VHTHGRVIRLYLFRMGIEASDLDEEELGITATVQKSRDQLQLGSQRISFASCRRIQRIGLRVGDAALPASEVYIVKAFRVVFRLVLKLKYPVEFLPIG